jgi:hypothetical protein
MTATAQPADQQLGLDHGAASAAAAEAARAIAAYPGQHTCDGTARAGARTPQLPRAYSEGEHAGAETKHSETSEEDTS